MASELTWSKALFAFFLEFFKFYHFFGNLAIKASKAFADYVVEVV